MTASFWKRFIISPFTTSHGGRCRPSSAIGTRSGSASGGSVGRGCSKPCSRRSPRRAPPPPRADARLDHGPCACVGSRRKRGQNGQALGRSRGGFSTKIHLKTDFDGLPLAFHLTGGEAGDSPVFEPLLDLGPDVRPRAAITDKGYDSRRSRAAARSRGIAPIIPYNA